MDTRVTYAQYEVLRMEHLLRRWVRRLEEYPRIDPAVWEEMEKEGTVPVPGQRTNEKWQWEALQAVATQTSELLALGAQRRRDLPGAIPDDFVLIRQPLPYGKTLEDLVIPREMKAPIPAGGYAQPSSPMGEGAMPQYMTWYYGEPYCHPVRHVRAFGYRKAGYKGTFALLTADHTRWPGSNRNHATFALCYDWMAPINWHVDLRNYQIATGPHTEMPAHEHKAQLSCLSRCGDYGRLIQRGKVVKTHVPVEWAMHLVPPYAVETP